MLDLPSDPNPMIPMRLFVCGMFIMALSSIKGAALVEVQISNW